MKQSEYSLLFLGLPVLLGGTDLLVKALVIAGISLALLFLCGLFLATWRKALPLADCTLAALLLASTVLSCASLLLQMHSRELFDALALFLPLLVLPCLQLAQREHSTTLSGLRPGLTLAALALLLGLLREGLGNATLLSHADWLFGTHASAWQFSLAGLSGLHLLMLAPGGFILLGLLLALLRPFLHATHDQP